MSIIYNKRNVKKKYLVGNTLTGNFAATDTLVEAKKAGKVIAKKLYGKPRYNVMAVAVTIDRRTSPISVKSTGWTMLVPVRGTGKSLAAITQAIEKHQKVKPMTWFKRK